jgi:subtilisin-like proprotein convertase family protein
MLMTHRFLGRRGRLALLLATALLSIGATAGRASAATTTFSNPTLINIPDDSAAAPYPSNIGVSGFAGNVQKVTATLNRFTHSYPDDIAVLLVGPSGANSILMGHVGGNSGTPQPEINITFDQASGNVLNTEDEVIGGTYRPSVEQADMEPMRSPAPPGPVFPVDLNVFNGGPANGTWSLFIDDQVAGDFGQVTGGWSLNITAPVNTATVGKPKLNKKKGTARLPVTVADAGNLALSGKGVATIASAGATKSVAVGGPGTTILKVKPKGKTRKKLNSTGKAKVKVKVTFTPNGGAPNTVTKKIKLKKTLG